MKVNIRVELDGNEFSLEDILAILVRDKEQPVVNIETVQPVEEVEPEDTPPEIVCKSCGTSKHLNGEERTLLKGLCATDVIFESSERKRQRKGRNSQRRL